MANKTATCETSLGTFKLELFTEQMPITAWNFIDLANTGNLVVGLSLFDEFMVL
jgi:cyclophilin family peptidyl-prolyl cis-trans isomerase